MATNQSEITCPGCGRKLTVFWDRPTQETISDICTNKNCEAWLSITRDKDETRIKEIAGRPRRAIMTMDGGE